MRAILFFIVLIHLPFASQAAKVLKTKGRSVLIENSDQKATLNQIYYLVQNKKKLGIVKIVKTKPGRAIGKLLKGKAKPGFVLIKRQPKSQNIQKALSAKSPTEDIKLAPLNRKRLRRPKRSRSYKLKNIALGFAAGYNSNSSDVDFFQNGNLSRSDSYTGTSTSFEGLLDYKIYKKIYLRASIGMHQFSAEDANNTQCLDNNGNPGLKCQIDLSYFNLDLWGRYYLTESWHKLWAGAGVGFLFSPKLNGTTALEPSDVGTTTLLQVGAGVDLNINKNLYAPIWAEYAMFPSSDTVKMTSVSFYFGLAYRL